jgi:hypothetical protein
MIEAGRYPARGVEGGLGVTSKGAPQVAVLVRITEGPNVGAELTWYGHFTEKTEEKTLDQLRVLGWSTDDLNDLSGIDANDVSIVVEHETNDRGETHAKIRWINRPGGGLAMKERMDDAAARAFAARMRAKAVASRAGAPKPAARTATPQRNGAPRFDDAPPPSDGDALPF